MKVLLVLVLVVAAAAVQYCPLATDIKPCVCTTEYIDARIHINLECSEVTSNAALKKVFEADFPFTKLSNLTIQPTISHPPLTSLEPNVFGKVSFEHILIDNTYMQTINEEALSPSHGTLISLILSKNNIDAFPFETLSVFDHLRFLNLANNRLPSLPNIESNSLRQVDLSGNVGLAFSPDTFKKAPELEELYLHEMKLTYFPPNVFSSLNNLKIIDLSKNDLKGVLGQGTIRVPLDAVYDLRLNNNDITGIDDTAITGVNREAIIDFQNNNIDSLDWSNWYPLLDQLNGLQVIDLRGNPLACNCDLVWLLLDLDELDKIHDETTCADGSRMKDTDVNDLLVIC